jgi:hypothetical protein
MACGKVDSGPYKHCTTQEILDLLKIVDDAIRNHRPGVGALTSASVNGKSFTYSTTGTELKPLSEYINQRNDLLDALADAMGDPRLAGDPKQTTAIFRGGWAAPGCPC